MRNNNIARSFIGVCAALLFLIATVPYLSEAEAAKKKKEETETAPPYKSSGPIPGTSLTYENLFINDYGVVTITIINPTSKGVAFSSKFNFYDGKGNHMAGFAISGFSHANDRKAHILQMDDYKKLKKAKHMKVLGRAGRSVE